MMQIFIFDGACEFCRFWSERWRARTGDRIHYASYQEISGEFPQIPEHEFERAAIFVESTGVWMSGAKAVCRLWTFRSRFGVFVWWCYRHVPLFANLAGIIYRHVARHRQFYWRLTSLVFRLQR